MTGRWIWLSLAVVVVSVSALGSSAGAKDERTLTDRQEVAFRTNGDGVTLRVVTGKGAESFQTAGVCGEPGCLPKPCQPVRAGYLAASTRAAVGEGYFDIYRREPGEPLRFLAGGSFGGIVEEPVGWVVVQVSPTVRRVDASFVNGGRDSVVPRDGLAVLASPVAGSGGYDGQVRPARLVARDADGTRVERLLVRENTQWSSPADGCSFNGLPGKFPKPTGRVPADSAAAQVAVIEAFQLAYGGTGRVGGDALSYIDESAGLSEVMAVATERFPHYAGKLSANVAEVRFIDADEAGVRFSIDVSDAGTGPGSIASGIGRAVLRDGRWLVARETFCTLLAAGGVYCPLDEKT